MNVKMILAAAVCAMILQPATALAGDTFHVGGAYYTGNPCREGSTYHATRMDEEYYNARTGKWERSSSVQEKLDDKKRPVRQDVIHIVPMGDDDDLEFRFQVKYHYRKSGYTIATYTAGELVDREKYWLSDGKVQKIKRYNALAQLTSTTVNTYRDGRLVRQTDYDADGNQIGECRSTYDAEGRLIRDRVTEYDIDEKRDRWRKTNYTYWENGKLRKAVTRFDDKSFRKIYCYSNGLVKKTREYYTEIGKINCDYTYKYYKKTKDVPKERICKKDGVLESRIHYSAFVKVPAEYESIPPKDLLDY